MEEEILNCIEGMLDLDESDIDTDDTFEALGFSDETFTELIYALEEVLGIDASDIERVIGIKDRLGKAINAILVEFE